MWPSSSSSVAPRPQAAVLYDGFAVIEGGTKLVELDDTGDVRSETALSSMPADTRVIGMVKGPGVVYRDGKKVVIGYVDDDGKIEQPQRFGRSVHKMCEQTASNSRRFAVSWTEGDGEIWFVHGPTKRRFEAIPIVTRDMLPDDTELRQPSYCGVASAGNDIVLLYRDGSRTNLVTCSEKRCSNPQTIKLDAKREILGFGCTKEACAIVTRDGNSVDASWAWLRGGKVEWTKPLPSPADDTRVTAVGVGAQVAIAYSIDPEPVVRVVGKDGAMKVVWQGRSDTVPGLAWSDTALLVAAHRDGGIATTIVRP
jgi:hypothetical protein